MKWKTNLTCGLHDGFMMFVNLSNKMTLLRDSSALSHLKSCEASSNDHNHTAKNAKNTFNTPKMNAEFKIFKLQHDHKSQFFDEDLIRFANLTVNW
jgi:hypothetical protein